MDFDLYCDIVACLTESDDVHVRSDLSIDLQQCDEYREQYSYDEDSGTLVAIPSRLPVLVSLPDELRTIIQKAHIPSGVHLNIDDTLAQICQRHHHETRNLRLAVQLFVHSCTYCVTKMCDSISAQLTDSNKRLEDRDTVIEKLKKDLDKVNCADLLAEIKSLNEELLQKELRVSELIDEKTTLKSTADAANHEVERLHNIVLQQNNEIKNVQAEYDKLVTERHTEKTANEQTLAQLKTELSELKTIIDYDDKQKETTIAELSKQLSEAKTSSFNLQQSLESLTRKNSEEMKIRKMKNKKRSQKMKYESDNKLARLKKTIQTLVADGIDKNEKISDLNKKLSEATAEIKALEKTLQERKENVEELKIKINLAKSDTIAERKKVRELRDAIQTNEKLCAEQLALQRHRINLLNSELEQAKLQRKKFYELQVAVQEKETDLNATNEVTQSLTEKFLPYRLGKDTVLQQKEEQLSESVSTISQLMSELDKIKEKCDIDKQKMKAELEKKEAELKYVSAEFKLFRDSYATGLEQNKTVIGMKNMEIVKFQDKIRKLHSEKQQEAQEKEATMKQMQNELHAVQTKLAEKDEELLFLNTTVANFHRQYFEQELLCQNQNGSEVSTELNLVSA